MIGDASKALGMRIAGAVLWLGYSVLLARLLSQEDFGLVLFAINFMLIATPVATLGFETASMRFGSQYWKAGKKDNFISLLAEARFFAALGGIFCLAALIIGFLSGLNTPLTTNLTIAIIVGMSIIASALMSIHRDILRSAGHLIVALLGFSITRSLIPLIGSLGLAMAGHLTVISALALYFASLGVSLIFEAWQISKLNFNSKTIKPTNVSDVTERKKHINVALGAWVGDATGAILARASGLVVGLVLGLEAAALYLVAERIANLGQFLTEAVNTAAAPEISRAAVNLQNDKSDMKIVIARASILMFIAGGVGVLGLILLGWPLFLLLGSQYISAYPILLILLFAQSSWGFFGPTAIVMNMAGFQIEQSFIKLLSAITVVFTTWLVLQSYGLLGAALAFAAVCWLMNLVQALYIYLRLKIFVGVLCFSYGFSFFEIFGISKNNIVQYLKLSRYFSK